MLHLGESDLASLLLAAERYQALEQLTFGHQHFIGMSRDGQDHILCWGSGTSLSELADNIRKREAPYANPS